MNENQKLVEGEYFLKKMISAENEPSEFYFLLSAFLSAARSVLQYALEEARKMPKSQRWYESKVSGSQILKFFKEKRDINIHHEPVQTNRHVNVSLQETIHVSEAVRIKITKAVGAEEIRESVEPRPPPKHEVPRNSKSSKYFFNDWSGAEDIVTLAQSYIGELRSLVSEGISKNYISG